MIPARAVRGIQPVIERALPYRCTILRATTATARPGYETEVFATHLTDVPCFLTARAGRNEAQTTDRTSIVADWRLNVPHGTDVTSDDRIGAVTAFGDTVLRSADGIEITNLVSGPTFISLSLRKVD